MHFVSLPPLHLHITGETNKQTIKQSRIWLKEMVWMETENGSSAKGKMSPPPPPPPPTPMKRTSSSMISASSSITNQEIAMFWKQKRLIKEDHLLDAIKAAARVRARKMTEEDYKYFEESLKRDDDENDEGSRKENKDVLIITERHTGVKDWWTKSKYAYLNQPAIDQDQLIEDNPKLRCRASSYIPNSCKDIGVAPSICLKTFGIF